MRVTPEDLDGRLAFVIGVKGALYDRRLTRRQLARRLAAMGGYPLPERPETIEYFNLIAEGVSEQLLRNGHPPVWAIGQAAGLGLARLSQRFPEEHLALVGEELGLGPDDYTEDIASHLVVLVLFPLLFEHRFLRLFGGEYGRAPYVPEAPLD